MFSLAADDCYVTIAYFARPLIGDDGIVAGMHVVLDGKYCILKLVILCSRLNEPYGGVVRDVFPLRLYENCILFQ